MNEEFDGVARISRRLEARRTELLAQLETAPELASLLEGLKATFGPVRLTHVEIGRWSHGNAERQPYWEDGSLVDLVGAVAFVPAPYHRPPTTRRGKAAAMRAREAAGQ